MRDGRERCRQIVPLWAPHAPKGGKPATRDPPGMPCHAAIPYVAAQFPARRPTASYCAPSFLSRKSAGIPNASSSFATCERGGAARGDRPFRVKHVCMPGVRCTLHARCPLYVACQVSVARCMPGVRCTLRGAAAESPKIDAFLPAHSFACRGVARTARRY